MVRVRRITLVVVALAVLAGCDVEWPQPNANPDRTNANPGAVGTPPADVGRLTQQWHVAGPTKPVVQGDRQIYGVGGSTLYDIDPATGAIVWQATEPEPISGGPYVEPDGDVRISYGQDRSTVGHEAVFSPGGENNRDDDVPIVGRLAARRGAHSVRMSTPGTPLQPSWLAVSGTPLSGRISPAVFEPTLGADLVYVPVAFSTDDSGVEALDPTQPCLDDVCSTTWFAHVPAAASVTIGPDGTVYVPGGRADEFGGRLRALDGGTGSLLWTSAANMSAGTPALDDGVVYVVGYNFDPAHEFEPTLFAISTSDGSTLWTSVLASPAAFPDDGIGVTAVGGHVLYAAFGSTVEAFAEGGCGHAVCTPLWTTDVGSTVNGLAVTLGRLLVSTDAGVTAFGIPH